ncbi:ThiF family adenylyltransferase [Candidatus Micrarchaeota archaeon]|nr:ThiF family adenylyltransferase [Candidatus Micrarchaeota archaeon]
MKGTSNPDLYGEKFVRNPLTKAQQAKVRKAVFAIVGLGGTGGFILENLLRMGVENLIVFDHDRFELSNFNRQPLATADFLDMPKVHAAVARAKAINKGIDITTHEEFGEGSGPAIKGAGIVLDGTDNVKSKLILSRIARAQKIPYVFCSAQGSRGIVSVFTSYRFEKAFSLPEDEDALARYQMCQSVICPAASLAGTLAASQAVSALLGMPYAKAPDAIFFDLFRKDVFWRGKLG